MQRSSAVLLVAGATGLFVTLGVLVRAVHSDASDVKSTATTAPLDHASPSAPIASRGPDMPGRPAWRPATPEHGEDSAAETTAPSLTSSDDHAPPATRGNTKNLHFGGYQLKTQAESVRPLIEQCVADKGAGATGSALLTYVVVQHGEKYEVEDTGLDDDKTTLKDAGLTDCLRETAKSMKFEGLPREATGLVVTRSVTLESGKLVEYKHVGFSYLR